MNEVKFNDEMDGSNALVRIKAGSANAESESWAWMLYRMYQQWCEGRWDKCKIVGMSGAYGGYAERLTSTIIKLSGEHMFGWLRAETGVHRLSRRSPLDPENRKHTSFATVAVLPDIEYKDDLEDRFNVLLYEPMQIRSYVFDLSSVTDLRTEVKSCDGRGVLNGDIDQFLKAGLIEVQD